MEEERKLQIYLDRTGTFWATILHKTELLEFDEEKNDLSLCALDPGIRTFNTVYDNQCTVTEIIPCDVGLTVSVGMRTSYKTSTLDQPGVCSK